MYNVFYLGCEGKLIKKFFERKCEAQRFINDNFLSIDRIEMENGRYTEDVTHEFAVSNFMDDRRKRLYDLYHELKIDERIIIEKVIKRALDDLSIALSFNSEYFINLVIENCNFNIMWLENQISTSNTQQKRYEEAEMRESLICEKKWNEKLRVTLNFYKKIERMVDTL